MNSSFKHTTKYTLKKHINKEMYEQAEAQGLQIYDPSGKRAVGVDNITGKVRYEYEKQPSYSSATIPETKTSENNFGSNVGKITYDNLTETIPKAKSKSNPYDINTTSTNTNTNTNNTSLLVDNSKFKHLLPNQKNTNTEREGSRIKHRIEKAITNIWKGANNSHLFDDIDDDTIEKNIPLAKKLVENNKKTGYLGNDPNKTYPYMLDGMTMYLASDDKNMPNAAKKSHDVAYWKEKNNKLESSSWKNISATSELTLNKQNIPAINEIKSVGMYGKTGDLPLANMSYFAETHTTHAPLKKSDPNSSLLSGQDLNIPREAQTKLLECKDRYAKAQEELNYIEMNRSHKEAAETRQQHYDYVDDYDYTHGGLYDIYTNGDDTYIEDGHYEHVFQFDRNSLNLLYEGAGNIYGADKISENTKFEVSNSILNVISKVLSSVTQQIMSVLKAGIGLVFDDIEKKEYKALQDTKSYLEHITNKYVNNNVDFYVYLLDGGTSTEFKLRAVDKDTKETLSENQFVLHQYSPYNALYKSSEKYGSLVAVNRRLWTYTYVK